MSEVLATIRAALRRRAGLAAPITANDVISLDPATREASCCDLHARLTGQEFSLLQALMVRSGVDNISSTFGPTIGNWPDSLPRKDLRAVCGAL
jgi:hypothetical protein